MQPSYWSLLFLLTVLCKEVDGGRKGGKTGAGSGDHEGNQGNDEPTEPPTLDLVTPDLAIYTVLENTKQSAARAINETDTRYDQPALCTYCRNPVGNSTNDLECRETSKQLCYSGSGCYRLTFKDKYTDYYHIEKGCWNKKFKGKFGECNLCKGDRPDLPKKTERIGCYCELCHGPMCNQEILLSTGSRAVPAVTIASLLYILYWTVL